MTYDLFISYSRRDDERGHVRQLAEEIERSFGLRVFFDRQEVRGMDDWRNRIQQALRDSRIFAAVLSPNFLTANYCRWEWDEYVRYEAMRQCLGEGIAPLSFGALEGNDRNWLNEVQRRQIFDLELWAEKGSAALRQLRATFEQLHASIKQRLDRFERAQRSPSNVLRPNPAFVGRGKELTELRDVLSRSQVGVVGSDGPVAVQGMGGMGKTELALAYAHAFAWDYPGGRWQVPCEHIGDLRLALRQLEGPLQFELSVDERADLAKSFIRVLSELNRRGRCLLILDNVTDSNLFQPAHLDRLPRDGSLDVMTTTRLAPGEIPGSARDQAFVTVDRLPDDDATALMRSHQPGSRFPDAASEEQARAIVVLLEGFTLAVETAAIFLGRQTTADRFARFAARLRADLLRISDEAAGEKTVAVRHGQALLEATLAPTLEMLSPEEREVLLVASLLPADRVALPWVNQIVSPRFPRLLDRPLLRREWAQLLQSLFGQRIFLPASADETGFPLLARMHRLVQDVIVKRAPGEGVDERKAELAHLVTVKANRMRTEWPHVRQRWQLGALTAVAHRRFDSGDVAAAIELALVVCDALWQLGYHAEGHNLLSRAFAAAAGDAMQLAAIAVPLARVQRSLRKYDEAIALMQHTLELIDRAEGDQSIARAVIHSDLGRLELDRGHLDAAEGHLTKASQVRESGFLYFNMADLEWRRGNLDRARELAAASISMHAQAVDELTGPQLIDQFDAMRMLATIERERGNDGESASVLRSVLEKANRLLTEPHIILMKVLTELAEFERTSGSPDVAERHFERARELGEALGEPARGDLVNILMRLIAASDARGDYDRSRALLTRRLELQEAMFGPSSTAAIDTVTSLALLDAGLGRLQPAQLLMERVLAARTTQLGPDDLVHSFQVKASLDAQLKDEEALRSTLESALEFVVATYGPEDKRLDQFAFQLFQLGVWEISQGRKDRGMEITAHARSRLATAGAPAQLLAKLDDARNSALRKAGPISRLLRRLRGSW